MTAEEQKTALGVIGNTATTLIASLPAQFLMLVLLNTAFLAGLLWFLNNTEDRRERIFSPILADCMKAVPLEAIEGLRLKQ